MSKLRKISFVLILILVAFLPLTVFNFNTSKIYAENNYIELGALKVSYQNSNIKDSNNNTKKLGAYTSKELYDNYNEIVNTKLTTVDNNDVISLDFSNNEAVLVTLMPKANSSAYIKMLSASLMVNGVSVVPEIYKPGENEQYIFIMAFDNTTPLDVNYAGKYDLAFSYSYVTNAGTFSDTNYYSFYIIDNTEYFENQNQPVIENVNSSNLNATTNINTSSFNYSTENKPNLKYNPYKFNPIINFTYNETIATITSALVTENDGDYVLFTSTNQSVYKDTKIKVNSNYNVELQLNTLGKYDITYNIVIQNGENSYEVIPNEQTTKLKNLKSDVLYIFGFETFYKHYPDTNPQNAYYTQLYNENFYSDFSYLNKDATTNLPYTNINNFLANLSNDNKNLILSKIAVTNQAPVKLNGYITSLDENDDINDYRKAEYCNIDNDFNIIADSTHPFTTSTRFEKAGTYLVFIPYNFSNLDTANTATKYYQVLIFKIANDTPTLEIKTVENSIENQIATNNYTNKNVRVKWSNFVKTPFTVQPKITFYKQENVSSSSAQLNIPNEMIKLDTTTNQNFIDFTDSGEYLVKIEYGINYSTNVTKYFTIDKTPIDFKVYSVVNGNILGSVNNFEDNIIKTNKPFSIFALNKNITNQISVNYESLYLNKEETTIIDYKIENDKLNIYNNWYLETYYSDLLYINSKLNNLVDYDSLSNYAFDNNENAIISNAGLYKFTISDLAGNSKTFYVLLDNTDPIVLHTNAVKEENTELLNFLENNTLSVKQAGENLVSNAYSVIFGNNKAIKFKINDKNLDFAKTYFNNNSLIDSSEDQYIITPYTNISVNAKAYYPSNYDTTKTYSQYNMFNILSITPPDKEEINILFDVKYNVNNTNYAISFTLNTDKNQILIYGYDNKYYNIQRESVTNSKQVYVRYLNESIDEEYKLSSLILKYYPFVENSNNLTFTENFKDSFDLLKMSNNNTIEESDQNTNNSVLSGGFISNLINPTYLNGETITAPGKYTLTKTYVNGQTSDNTITFYVDRYSPIEIYSSSTLIGKNIKFNLANSTLSAENILYYIQNNQDITTNKLPITTNLNNTVYKYLFENDEFKLYYQVINNNVVVYDSKTSTSNYYFNNRQNYVIRIYDNSGYKYDGNTNINPNFIDFRINLTDTAPDGYYIIDGNKEITEAEYSTNSNSLSFIFQDSTSDYLYDIDLNNIVLKMNNSIIFQTQSIPTSNFFTFGSEKIYYISNYNLTLTRTRLTTSKIPSNKLRYKYTLTILDPNNMNGLFDENGMSLEATYELTLNYLIENNYSILNNNSSKTFKMTVDHTAPFVNVNKYIDNDKFLTAEEKEILKQSVANKDRTSKLNFDNYAIVITETPTFVSNQDTSSIYIRKYNKYSDITNACQQSLVIGDEEYNNLTTTRYKFDINALDSDRNKIYTSKEYNKLDNTINNKTLNDFFENEGFYEIIEIDQANNYTIYTVLYLTDYSLSANYTSTTNSNIEVENVEVVNDVNFELTNISNKYYDYLNVKVSINGTNHDLRYFPVSVENDTITYFNSISDIISYVNNLILSDTTVNKLGCKYTIDISNRNGNTISITINTPNELLDISIIDYEDRFILTIPDNNIATYVQSLTVSAVVYDETTKTYLYKPLKYDSNQTALNSNPNSSFVFSHIAYLGESISNLAPITVSIYKIEWKDNFNREQNKVKIIGVEDKKVIDFGNNPYETINGVDYTADKDNVKLIYQSHLYNLNVYYSILPNTNLNQLTFPTSNNIYDITYGDGIREINLIKILAKEYDEDAKILATYDWQIKFTIELTDLTTIGETPNIYTLSYIYYPDMPSIDFTDSSSNNLEIKPIKSTADFTISTSKNVTLSYLNSTLFPITINAKRTYVTNLNEEITENINDITSDYTFTQLGDYEIVVKNSLNNQNIYKFSIKQASNKTYAVYTNEPNMTNFELFASKNVQTYIIGAKTITCDTYYSIYNAIIEVNSDFNLIVEEVEVNQTEYPNTTFHLISKVNNGTSTPYKYIAITKIEYNSNFLNVSTEESKLEIYEGEFSTENLAENIKTYYLKVTDKKLTITLPLYNEVNANLTGNTINVKLYLNNEQISLNENIYQINEETKTQTIILNNVPAGVYNFYFEDLAGNVQYFSGNSFLSIILLTEVIVSINNENPIEYQIYNNAVNVKIEQERQYNTGSLTINAFINGKKINKLNRNSNGEYVFTDYGLYTIELNAIIDSKNINKTIHFTILNSKVAYKEFSYIGLNGQVISKIIRDGKDITSELTKFISVGNDPNIPVDNYKNNYLYKINLASTIKYAHIDPNTGEIKLDDEGNQLIDTYNGSGLYEIYVKNENTILSSQNFSFNVWIRDNDAKAIIKSSVKEGGSTTNAITFTYNPYLIYSQIGECGLYINNEKVVDITNESLNEVNTYTIERTQKGTFVVQVKSDDGNTELSFVVYKKEPLSTTSIIVIVVSSIVIAAIVVVFIKLRTRMKVK